MASQNLLVKPLKHQHFSMFRGLFSAAKKFYFLIILFCTISILVTCNGCSVNEAQRALSGWEVTGSCNVNFETGSQFVLDGHASSELVVQRFDQRSFVVTLDYRANDPYSNSIRFYPCSSSAVTSPYCLHFTKDIAVKSTCSAKPIFCFGVCSSGMWRKNTSCLNHLNGTLCAVGVFGSTSFLSGNAREREELVPKHEKLHFSTSVVPVLDANKPEQPVQLIPNSSPEQISFKVFNVTMIWKCVKKMLILLFSSALVYLLVCPLFFRLTAFKAQDSRYQKNSFLTANCALESSHRHSNLVISFAVSSKVKIFLSGEEILFLESVHGLNHDPREAYHIQTDSLLKLSWLENSDTQKESNSENLNVRVGKEKRRKRRKKKSADVSSSLSGNSSECCSLSPVASRKPLFQENNLQAVESKCSKPFPKVNNNNIDAEIIFRRKNHNMHYSAQRKPNFTRKVNAKAVPLLSTCHYPVLASKSKLALHERAPGRRSHSRGNYEFEAKMDLKEEFTYDIWGDHLFGPPPTYKSKTMSNSSMSFFVRDLQTVMKDSMLNPVS